MGACIYHHCQTCKVTSYYLAGTGKTLAQVVTHCIDCGAPMKPVVRHGVPHIVCKYWHVRGNYKKKQQAKSKARNTTPCFHERMKRISQRYK